MNPGRHSTYPPRLPARRGFTLIELLLAIILSAVILAAVNAVLFGSLRLRNRTALQLDNANARQQALDLIHRDLAGIVLPGGDTNIAGQLLFGPLSGVNDLAGTGMQIFTSTGIPSPSRPGSDIIKVGYVLRDPTNNATSGGRNLFRVVTRNLLPINIELFEEQFLLPDVERLEFYFFDGATWRPTWTGTNELVSLPRAIRVELTVAELDPDQRGRGVFAQRSLLPFQLVVPIEVSPATNVTETLDDGGQP
jgi:type II secretion system protein J